MKQHPLKRILVAIARVVMAVIFPYKVIGKEHLLSVAAEQPRIICCNHISIVDPVFLLCGQNQPIYFMAKAELFQNRFTRWLFGNVMGAFPVERGKGDMGAVNHALDLVRAGNILGIFPQGTCRRTRELGQPKSGAALIACRTQATVIPACLITKDFHVRAFRRTTLIFGEPLTPDDLQLKDEEHPKLRFASRAIMERMDALIETGLTAQKVRKKVPYAGGDC